MGGVFLKRGAVHLHTICRLGIGASKILEPFALGITEPQDSGRDKACLLHNLCRSLAGEVAKAQALNALSIYRPDTIVASGILVACFCMGSGRGRVPECECSHDQELDAALLSMLV